MSGMISAAVVTVGTAVGKGVSAMGNKGDVAAGQAAAGQIYEDKLDLLGNKRALSLDATQSQFTGGQRDIGLGIQTGQRNIAYNTGNTNLATSGTMQTQTSDLLAKAKSDMTKLFETRDLSRTEANLGYRSGKMSAEEAYQNTLTGLSATPTTFLEGVFS